MDGHEATAGPRSSPAADTLPTVLGLTASVLQSLLLAATLVLGLTWGGWSWLTALALELLGLGVIVVLTLWRRRQVLAVPPVSFLLAAGLSVLGPYPIGSA
ncbi:hypothetical protein ACH9EU_10070 [Kocuria sp. M1R5S2]|uniref:hypothetical protein n=1 Tax=Kocuria rhizosphaerae TaxID=3376285 RepID=UPI00379DEF35